MARVNRPDTGRIKSQNGYLFTTFSKTFWRPQRVVWSLEERRQPPMESRIWVISMESLREGLLSSGRRKNGISRASGSDGQKKETPPGWRCRFHPAQNGDQDRNTD